MKYPHEITWQEQINHQIEEIRFWEGSSCSTIIRKAILKTLQEAQQREGKCMWVIQEYYETSCGGGFVSDTEFEEPETTFKYCPYCGKQIEFVRE